MAYTFINPYNFIPLGSGKKTADEPKEKNSLSGVISYSLLTKTPLFIPNTSNDNAFDMKEKVADHKSYDFFSYKDLSSLKKSVKDEPPRPVIPGSEMRGMLRSNYEILTDSCMSAVDDDKLLSKRTQEKFQPGLLKRKKVNGRVTYELYDADDCLVRTKGENTLEDEPDPKAWSNEKRSIKSKEIWGRKCYQQEQLPEGSKVEFDHVRRKMGKNLASHVKKTDKSSVRLPKKIGYIIKGEAGPEMKLSNGKEYFQQNKHCLHVFCQPSDQDKCVSVLGKKELSEEELASRLDAVLSIYQQNAENAYDEYGKEYKKFKAGEGETYFPVYYSILKYRDKKADGLMFAPACITREVYISKLSDMAKTHRSCENSEKLCPACSLFGTLKKENKNSVTSRLRVTDLECMETDVKKCFDKEPVTLQPLSAPKFNPEFYIKKPDAKAVFWTYEYYVDQDGKIHRSTMKINGRKFYWHHPDFSLENCKGEASNQNKTIRPLKAGITFRGKIYFQNISEEELNTLCYLINAGESSDIILEEKKHGYKLGAAKPLGLGSVALHVDEVLLRKFTMDEEEGVSLVEETYIPDMDNTLADQTVTAHYALMTEFDYLKEDLQSGNAELSYPKTEKCGDIFEWFSENHTGYRTIRATGKKVITGMPASRQNMLFKEYLEPMKPETKKIEFTKKLLADKNDNKKNFSASRNNDKGNRSHNGGRNHGNRNNRNYNGKKKW